MARLRVHATTGCESAWIGFRSATASTLAAMPSYDRGYMVGGR